MKTIFDIQQKPTISSFLIRYQQILQYQMDNDDSDEIVATCMRHGDDDPQLWIQALSYFAKLKRVDGCRKEIQQILKCLYNEFN